MNNSLLVIFLLISVSVVGQNPKEKRPRDISGLDRWTYDGFSYADFGTGEQHSYASLLYELNPKLYFELQTYYDTYRTADILDVSLRMRWYPAKKFYVFTGAGMQLQRPKIGDGQPVTPFRIINGFGYEPKENTSIEAVHDLNFSTNGASTNFLTLKGKYRF